jgi:hypothetical protein
MMLGPTESRSSLRGKTFGERALPGMYALSKKENLLF